MKTCECEGTREIKYESKIKRPEVSKMRQTLLNTKDTFKSLKEKRLAMKEMNLS